MNLTQKYFLIEISKKEEYFWINFVKVYLNDLIEFESGELGNIKI